jgi:tripartite-type tricarboxylate transporter receptor subunit TctC
VLAVTVSSAVLEHHVPLGRNLRKLRAFLLPAVLAVVACQPQAEWPDRPLLLLCPWAVGGGTDRVSRQVGAFLEQELGVPVNVVNATGGAGVTGHSRGSSARPDGYTLTMMTVEINMLRWRKLTKISWEDFTPIMLLNRDAAAIFVHVDSPWHRLEELAAAVRDKPGALTASGTATGGIWHLAFAGWLRATGLEPDAAKWVPSAGSAPALQDLASGGLDVVCCSLPEARALLGSGKLRSLGVMADTRVTADPETPTLREEGVDWVMGAWRGLALPRDVPEEIVNRLLVALERIVKGETVVAGERFGDFMAREGFDASWEPPAQFRETLRRTDQDLGALLTSEAFSSLMADRFRPYDFPLVLGVLFGVLLVGLWAQGARPAALLRSWSIRRGAVVACVEIVLAIVVFVGVVETAGFLVTAGGIVFLLLWRLGSSLRVSLLVTLVFVPLVYQLFHYGLRVPLPRGWLGW